VLRCERKKQLETVKSRDTRWNYLPHSSAAGEYIRAATYRPKNNPVAVGLQHSFLRWQPLYRCSA